MKVIGWRAWYDDGSVYDSRTTAWEALPPDGVLCVMLYFDEPAPDGRPLRRIMEGSDHYFKAEGHRGPTFGDTNDPLAEISQRYPGASVKRGKWTDDEAMHRVRGEAMASTWG